MKKLFVFDLDGTLLNHQSLILQQTIEAIKELKKDGHYFSIATGRGIASSDAILKQCPYFDFAICNNGVIVKNLKTGNIVTNGFLPIDLFEKFLQVCESNGSQYTISTTKNVYPIKFEEMDYHWMNGQEKMDYDLMNWVWPEEVRKAIQKGEKITQIALRNSEEESKKMFKYFLPTIGKEYSTFLTNKVYYDINPLGSDKKNGVLTLLKQLKLSSNDLVVFGDSGNDIEMIRLAKYGFAMGNGTTEAKKAAFAIIGDHNEPTIAKKMLEFK